MRSSCSQTAERWGRGRLLALSTLIFSGLLSASHGQTPPQLQPQPNPLMQLMLSQPNVDVTSPVTATATFDPPAVRPGQKAIYRITLNAIASNVRVPERIPAPPELEVKLSAQGQILRSIGNSLQPLTSINYEVRGNKSGMFLVPAFYVEAYGRQVVVPAASLEVAADVEASEVPRQLVVRATKTNLFVGEQVMVQVLLPATPSNNVEAVREIQINGDGLFVDKSAIRQTIAMVEWNGRQAPSYVYEAMVTPISAGALSVSAQGFASGGDFGGPIVISGQAVIPGGLPQYVLLDSEPITLNVRMLPPEGELPGFKGAIGQLTCDPPQLFTNTVKVGEPIELWVAVRANVNLARLVPPDPPRVKGWQSFPPANRGYVGGHRGTNAGIVLAYTFIPLSDELRATPEIPFSAFDPRERKFVDLTIPSVPITVLPDPAYTNSLAAIESTVGSQTPRKLTLSGVVTRPGKSVASLQPLQVQPWFVGLQLSPVFLFGGLWWWERRRQYLERHPEIVRRRQAKRELRRVKQRLRRAAREGAGADFTQLGVSALQIACAPHFPANPRALVCSDVLEVFDAGERQGKTGDIVRQFFTGANVQNFANGTEKDGKLLGLAEGLETVLLKLEERL